MAISAKTTVVADNVLCKLSDGANTIEWDIAEGSNPLLGHGQHTVNKWISQAIKAQGFVKDGVYEATTISVTFLASEFEQIETWWKSGTKVTYTVTGLLTGDKAYSDCIVRVASTPQIVPGQDGYVVFQIEISCLSNPSGT